ncbi:site-specific integrase [Acinetobacter vivianii]|nr:site-specific integrase [Acinetobacter vivianii]
MSTKAQEVGWAVLFAIETAMRLGEITSMTWENVHIDAMYVHLPDTKNGLSRNIPLSEKAEHLLLKIKNRNHGNVLSISSETLSTLFRRYRNQCGIEDLRFHDLRHEATTRMAQIIQNPADLAKITGHTDINILVNTYHNPTPTEVATRLRQGKIKL